MVKFVQIKWENFHIGMVPQRKDGGRESPNVLDSCKPSICLRDGIGIGGINLIGYHGGWLIGYLVSAPAVIH